MGQNVTPAINRSAELALKESVELALSQPPLTRLLARVRNYSAAAVALLLLLISLPLIKVGGSYWSAHVINAAKPAYATAAVAPTIAGLNLTVPANQLQDKLQAIAGQPVTLTVGDQTIPVGTDTIKSWLQITASQDKSEYYLRVKANVIADSLKKLATDKFVKAPVNQVTVNEDGVNVVAVNGRNGTALSNAATLETQAGQVAKTVMDAKGLQFSTPLVTAPFQSVTPAAFDKLLVASVGAKKMWAFQNGQQVNSWLVSAGAPDTPTPLGEFHVYAKFTVQDMRGTYPKPYFQPHVRWINYFYQGSAVHGVYWHPLSWFGAINSSHGCIGLPEDEAQWIFNWAPIGTTVIVNS